MSVKVSICIPTYNQIDFLKKNLESIRIQNYSDFEVIISDDSNTSEVQKLVQSTFQHSGIIYTYHKNEKAFGSPANWNKAVSLAQGQYIKILHHDDWFNAENSLRHMVETMDAKPECDFLFCVSSVLNVATQSYSENRAGEKFINELKENPLVLFNNNRIGSPSSTMYRASCKINFDEKLSYLVDVDQYIGILRQNPNFIFLPEPLIVNTSNHPEQVTASSINKITQVGEYCYLYDKLFKGAFPDKKHRHFFKQLFSWYKLKHFSEIESQGYKRPSPEWIFNLLLLQSKLVG